MTNTQHSKLSAATITEMRAYCADTWNDYSPRATDAQVIARIERTYGVRQFIKDGVR